jgi:hypothetical protein
MLIKQNKVYAKQGVSKLIGIHEEAADWVVRVRNNGGSVSPKTIRAVSKFCIDIDTAGLRDRFYRLNLFAGTGLNACLVPLYRGPSRTGTQYGNTTDTNQGPFVSGDYAETGASGGLKGDGNTKNLDTGFVISASDSPVREKGHLSSWVQTKGTSRRAAIGVRLDTAPAAFMGYDLADTLSLWGGYGSSAAFQAVTGSSVPHHVLVQQASQSELFDNGAVLATAAASTAGALSRNMTVFTQAFGTGTSVLSRSDARLGSYSSGLDLTSTQVAAYYTALETFMIALGRK